MAENKELAKYVCLVDENGRDFYVDEDGEVERAANPTSFQR